MNLEPVYALANQIFLQKCGSYLGACKFGEDTGITASEARAYASQFAASSRMKLALTAILSAAHAPTDPNGQALAAALALGAAALAACEPKTPGMPFRSRAQPNATIGADADAP